MDLHKLANPGALTTKEYVPGKSKQEVQRELGLDTIIKMASNESAIGASEKAKEALDGIRDQLHVYPDAASRDLRRQLARRLGCTPDQVTVGNGADGVIYTLGMAVIGEGDEAIIPEITFPLYETIVKVMRGVPVTSGMAGYRIDLEAILDAVNERTKVIFLCNPNNPTGDAQEPNGMQLFLQKVPRDVLVVIDEAYIDFAAPECDPKTCELFTSGMENLFILRSFSKIFGLAGLRVGYGIGNSDLVTLIHRIKPPFSVSLPAEHAALAALEDEQFARKTLEEMEREKAKYYRTLDELGLTYVKSHTNFILIDTRIDAKRVFNAILKQGIIVRPCNGFGLPSCIRVTIGGPEENDKFLKVFKDLMNQV